MLVLTVIIKLLSVSVMKICVETVSLSLHKVDLETSFLNEQEIQDITEGLIAKVMKKLRN